MKDGKPETLEEALAIIAEQKNRLSEKDEIIRQKDIINAQNEQIIRDQQEQIQKLTAWRFARHSEKCTYDQPELDLFDYEPNPVLNQESEESEVTDQNLSESVAEKVKSDKKKSKAGRKKIARPENMIVREYRLELPEDKRKCPQCGSKMVVVRYETSENIIHVPASEYIERIIRPVYECKNCEKDDGTAVTAAAQEKRMINRSIASPSLLAHIFTQKFARHIPFYRLSQSYAWQGLRINRQSMSDWLIECAGKLKPLEQLLIRQLGKGQLIQMDETVLDVLRQNPDEIRAEYKDDKKALKAMKKADEKKSVFKSEKENCYEWVFLGGTKEKPVHLYQFFWTRCGGNIEEYLKNFEGSVIMTDGFSGYDSAVEKFNETHLEHKIVHCGCMIHAKRKFNEAITATNGASETAKKGLKYYQTILHREKKLEESLRKEEITEEKFLSQRKEQIEPVLNEFHEWLLKVKDNHEVRTSSSTGTAINYSLNQWDKLVSFMNYSFCPAHNNAAEQAVRPFTVGRKNWLFAGSGEGARAASLIYSLIETAKLQNLVPEDYLRCLFEKAPYAETTEDWEKLLPWNIEVTPFIPRGEVIGLTGEN